MYCLRRGDDFLLLPVPASVLLLAELSASGLALAQTDVFGSERDPTSASGTWFGTRASIADNNSGVTGVDARAGDGDVEAESDGSFRVYAGGLRVVRRAQGRDHGFR